ncbi:MAG: aspartyl/asparaginyl beta-hydroxylase domain-containing protein [Woeseiaceae bacterium]|nr:aspartyl/asparaginyl beta-hydroxylase domain-containing protein [Woeseiaceae bacterium]
MNIDTPLKSLGPVDVTALSEAVLALDDATWRQNEKRQQDYEVHRLTRSVVMVFCEGTPEDLEVRKEAGWELLAPAALPVMEELIGRGYAPGGVVIRAMAAKLLAGGRIDPHFDSHTTFRRSHRIHVPITTNHRVRFTIDGRPYRLKVGEAYEINNQKVHSVINSGTEDRITFIFDYLPPTAIGAVEAEQTAGRA